MDRTGKYMLYRQKSFLKSPEHDQNDTSAIQYL